MDFFLLMEFESFWSIWFWIVVVISWSMTSHWTLGVPFDLIIQADRQGGIWSEYCEAMTRINVHRIVWMFRSAGLAITTAGAFFLAAIGTLGFYTGLELARALFVLLLPHAIVAVYSVRLAFWLEANELDAGQLRAALKKRRFWTQVIGLGAIATAAGFGVWEVASQLAT